MMLLFTSIWQSPNYNYVASQCILACLERINFAGTRAYAQAGRQCLKGKERLKKCQIETDYQTLCVCVCVCVCERDQTTAQSNKKHAGNHFKKSCF